MTKKKMSDLTFLRMCGSKYSYFGQYFGILLEILKDLFLEFLNKSPCTAPPRGTTTMGTANTPPRRKRGAEVSLGRRYAMVVEIAMAIPPGKNEAPQGHCRVG